MTLTELRYIVAVARERHFGRAAEACFVSQPTLSVAVRKLEEELGVTLFERSPGEVSVTPIGTRILEQAQRILEQSDAIKVIAAEGEDELSGMVRLGVIYTIAPYLLPSLIQILRSVAPKLRLQIEENFTARLSERLKQANLDLLLLSLPYAEAGVQTEALYEEPFVVLMPAPHRLQQEVVITPSMLAREDLLLLGPGHCFRDQVLQACPECNRTSVGSDSMQKTLEGSSLETMRLMVATGMGVTVLPRSAVNEYNQQSGMISVRPFAEPAPRRVVALAWRKSFPRIALVRMLADAVRACPLDAEIRVIPAPQASTSNRLTPE